MKQAISGPGVTSLVYVAHLDSKFGKAWVEWEPETLWQAIEDEWGVTPSEGAKAAMMAARVVLSNDSYYTDIQTFEAVTQGLNNHQPAFDRYQVCQPHEIAYALAQVDRLRDRPAGGFSEDVVHYIRGCMREYGMYGYPTSLKFAEPDEDKQTRDKIRGMARKPPVKPGSMVEIQASKLHDLYVYIEARNREARNLDKKSSGAS